MNAASFLSAMQLADSALPSGRFAHSAGLEALVGESGSPSETELSEFVASHVCDAVAPLDGVVVAHAVRARSLEELLALDACVAARKLTPGTRLASTRCGRQLARATDVLTDDALAKELASAVRERAAEGHLAVVEGTLARAVGLSDEEAVLVALRGAASGALSAALRLGAISAHSAQRLLSQLHPSIVQACARAIETPLAHLHSSAPELEILALAHPRGDARSFTT